jgi:hypothetical protein
MLKASTDEEEMVHVCEPEAGRNLSDEDELRSLEDLRDFQEGRTKISNFQVGNEMRSLRDLIDCQEDSRGISDCQVGNEMRSLWDLIDCQGGSRELPYFQEGKGEKMSSEMSSYQQGQLTEKEDQRNLLMIGGIQDIPAT